MHTLKEMVSHHCQFSHYRNGTLYYLIYIMTDEGSPLRPHNGEYKYIFPIDITDTKEIGSSTFNFREKSLLFMRYIRKAIKENTISEYKEPNGGIDRYNTSE